MKLTILSLMIMLCAAAAMFIGGLRGYKKGMSTALIRLAVIAVSALTAVLVAPLLTRLTMKGAADAILKMFDLRGQYAGYPGFKTLCNSFLRGLLSPIVALILFLTLWGIAGSILRKIQKRKTDRNKQDLVLRADTRRDASGKADCAIGASVGVIAGLTVCMIIFAPVTGTFRTIDTMMTVLTRTEGFVFRTDKKETDTVSLVAHDMASSLFYSCGGRLLYETSARTWINDEVYLPANELEQTETIMKDIRHQLLRVADPDNPDRFETSNTLLDAAQRAESSPITRHLLYDYLRIESFSWETNYTQRTAGRQIEESPLITSLLSAYRNTDRDTVCDDLQTTARVYSGIATLNMYDAGDRLSTLTEKGIMDMIYQELSHSKTFEPCVESLNDFAANAFMVTVYERQKRMPYVFKDMTANLANTINSTVTYSGERRLYAVRDALMDYASMMNIKVDTDILTAAAQKIAIRFEERDDTVNADEIALLFGVEIKVEKK